MGDFTDLIDQAAGPTSQTPAPVAKIPAFDPNASYGTPTKLLDNLMHTESAGDPYAVNKDTGAMGAYQFMPATVAGMRKQGVNFDPFNAQQSRSAADYYISNLVKANGGDYSKAMAQYGGFVTKDPTAYVSKVLNGVTANYPSGTQSNAQAPSDPNSFTGLIDAAATVRGQKAPSQATANPTQNQKIGFDSAPHMLENSVLGNLDGATNVATSMIANPISNIAGLAATAYEKATGGKTTGDEGDGPSDFKNYVQDAFTWKPRTEVGQAMAEYNPLSLVGKGLSYVGNAAGGEIKGDAAADTARGVIGNTVGEAIPQFASMFLPKAIGKAFGGKAPIEESVPQKNGSPTPSGIDFDVPTFIRNKQTGMQMGAPQTPTGNMDIPTYLRKQQANAASQLQQEPVPQQVQPSTVPAATASIEQAPAQQPQEAIAPAANATPSPAPVVQASANPAAKLIDQLNERINSQKEKVAPVQPLNEPEIPAPVKPIEITPTTNITDGSKLSPQDQANRTQILKDAGITETDKAAIAGDQKGRAIRYQMGKYDEPAGNAASDAFAQEKQDMANNLTGQIQKVGGNVVTDQTGMLERGRSSVQPLDDMANLLEQQKQELYKTADQRSGGMPIASTPTIDTLLKDPTFLNTASALDKDKLVTSIGNQLENIKQNNGGKLNVGTAETFRKWLNQIYSPDNKTVIGKVKDALDQDVFQNAGEDVYGQARSIHKQQMDLESQKGIENFLNVDPKNPEIRKVSYEKVPDAISGLPADQYQSYVNTLKGLPPEIQPQAQAALGQMKSHLLNKAMDSASQTKGGFDRPYWDGQSFGNFVDKNRAKFEAVMSPEELKQLDTARQAGDILSFNPAYPGASAQAANSLKQGLMSQIASKATTAVASGVGGLAGSLFGPGGTVAGGAAGAQAGGFLSGKMSEGGALKQYQKGRVRLSDIPP